MFSRHTWTHLKDRPDNKLVITAGIIRTVHLQSYCTHGFYTRACWSRVTSTLASSGSFQVCIKAKKLHEYFTHSCFRSKRTVGRNKQTTASCKERTQTSGFVSLSLHSGRWRSRSHSPAVSWERLGGQPIPTRRRAGKSCICDPRGQNKTVKSVKVSGSIPSAAIGPIYVI